MENSIEFTTYPQPNNFFLCIKKPGYPYPHFFLSLLTYFFFEIFSDILIFQVGHTAKTKTGAFELPSKRNEVVIANKLGFASLAYLNLD